MRTEAANGREGKENGGEMGMREGRGAWGGKKERKGMEGINLPHGRLKTLAALGIQY